MKPTTAARRTLVAALVASALAGCASDSGGSSNDSDLGEVLACLLTVPMGGAGCPRKPESTSSSVASATPRFSSFAELPRGVPVQGWSYEVAGPVAQSSIRYDSENKVSEFGPLGNDPAFGEGKRETLSAAGQPGIEVVSGEHAAVAVANPYDLGWNYQTFGVWNAGLESHASSFGNLTPATAIATTGAASFNGKLAGRYVSPEGVGSIASADLKVDANFGARSLDLASTGTTTTHNGGVTAMPGLDLTAALTYAPGSNGFAGTIRSASGMTGTSRGAFYGPAAQELGGVFAVRSATSVENFVGAYGAKR